EGGDEGLEGRTVAREQRLGAGAELEGVVVPDVVEEDELAVEAGDDVAVRLADEPAGRGRALGRLALARLADPGVGPRPATREPRGRWINGYISGLLGEFGGIPLGDERVGHRLPAVRRRVVEAAAPDTEREAVGEDHAANDVDEPFVGPEAEAARAREEVLGEDEAERAHGRLVALAAGEGDQRRVLTLEGDEPLGPADPLGLEGRRDLEEVADQRA